MKKPGIEVLKKRLTSLLLPIFLWVTLECAGRAAILIIRHQFNFIEFAHTYIDRFTGSLWFLWATFWCSLIVLLIEKAFKGKLWIYALLLIPMLFVPAVYNLHMYVYLYPFFVAGSMFNKYDGVHRYKQTVKKDWYALVIAAVVFIILFLFYGRDSFIYTTKISVLGEKGVAQPAVDVYRWTIGFAGSITVILLCKIICDRWQGAGAKLFAYFGQISLGIYILNSYTNSYLLQSITGGMRPNVLIWILESLANMMLYCSIVFILKKIPMANKLLLGGR